MIAGWQSLHFEECIEPVVYTAKIQRKDFLADGSYPVVSQEEALINGYWDQKADLFRVKRPLIVFGDHTRTLKYIDFDFVLGADGVKVLMPKPFLHPRFFYYQLHTAKLDSLGYARHYRLLKELQIAFPAYVEQQRIATILDEAFESIATAKASAEKNLHNSREWAARKMAMVIAATSAARQTSTLESLVASDCSLSYGIVQPGDEVQGGLPVVRPVDLRAKTVLAADLKRINPALALPYARTTLKGGDLLLCVRGTTGTVAVAEVALAGANVTRGIVPIRFDPNLVSQALGYYLLRSEPFQAEVRAKTYGTALMQINISDLRKIKLSVPPIDRQASIVEQLDSVQDGADQLAAIYKRKIVACDELKGALLNQAFAGTIASTRSQKAPFL